MCLCLQQPKPYRDGGSYRKLLVKENCGQAGKDDLGHVQVSTCCQPPGALARETNRLPLCIQQREEFHSLGNVQRPAIGLPC